MADARQSPNNKDTNNFNTTQVFYVKLMLNFSSMGTKKGLQMQPFQQTKQNKGRGRNPTQIPIFILYA